VSIGVLEQPNLLSVPQSTSRPASSCFRRFLPLRVRMNGESIAYCSSIAQFHSAQSRAYSQFAAVFPPTVRMKSLALPFFR
jgi:hypothetical protein